MAKKTKWHRYIISVLVCFLTVSYGQFHAGFAMDKLDAKLVRSYLAPHCNDQQMRFMLEGSGVWPGHQTSGQQVFISAQSGKSDLEKLKSAIGLAKKGDTLVGAPHLLIDIKGQPIELPPGVTVKGNWMRITSSLKTKHLVRSRPDSTHFYISEVVFDGAGNDHYASLLMRGVEYAVVQNNVFMNTAKSALTIESSELKAAQFVKVTNNYMHSPAKGIAHTIFIKSRFDGRYVKCVSVIDNVAYGTNPSQPALDDYTAENEFSADQITLHGVQGFVVSGNYSAWSGSSGFTISRMSRDGIISNNIAEMCYEPGFNIGSGYEAVYVKDISNFRAGDIIKGESRATLQIKAVLPDKTSSGGWLRGNARHDWLVPGEKLSKESDSQFSSPVLKVARSTENILLSNNTAIETGIQGNKKGHLGAFNAIRSDNLRFLQNTYSNKQDIGKADKFISLSLSKAYLYSNSPSYQKNSSEYQIAGPKSEVLQD